MVADIVPSGMGMAGATRFRFSPPFEAAARRSNPPELAMCSRGTVFAKGLRRGVEGGFVMSSPLVQGKAAGVVVDRASGVGSRVRAWFSGSAWAPLVAKAAAYVAGFGVLALVGSGAAGAFLSRLPGE